MTTKTLRTHTHWGAYDAEVRDGDVVKMTPIKADADPSSIGAGMPQALKDQVRIAQPMVRLGWLENGPRKHDNRRGAEPFVPVSWERALDLVAGEVRRVRDGFGPGAIYAGSYGWASAGKFHLAQPHLRKFLNLLGGNVKSVNSYSLAAGDVVMQHVAGSWTELYNGFTSWPVLADNTKLFIMFGGIPLKNAQVDGGGAGRHIVKDWLRKAKENGARFIYLGPVREDAADFLDAEWLTPRPNSDVAVMMGMAHTLVSEGLHNQDFLDRCTVGFDRVRAYLMGETDGTPKTAEWAAEKSGLPADVIRRLARDAAATRTIVTASWSLQRQDHGEMAFWTLTTLAAIVGQIGLPGGGFGMGYGAISNIGNPARNIGGPLFGSGTSTFKDFIPVARIADMLLNPGQVIDYNGQKITFNDTRLVYWVGGNPFHHHQDLNRLVRAWQEPETIVVHEPWWNANARHADIVLPVTTPLERNDIGTAFNDDYFFPMHKAMEPFGQSKSDFDIFSELSDRFGIREDYTENRDEDGWLRYMYNQLRQMAASENAEIPDYETFRAAGELRFPTPERPRVLMQAFVEDPRGNPLKTPSGKLELYSETIAGFGYDNCPPQATWMEPVEWLGAPLAKKFPFHLVSNQPKTRLHSQYDNGGYSRSNKIRDREPVLIHPADAAKKGIKDGDIVRLFNDRGASLAGAQISDGVMQGCVQLPTGAWYDPVEPGGLDTHGNPNVLTRDSGSSKLAQGPSAHSCLVDIERFDGVVPPVRAFEPPPIVHRLRSAKGKN